jgi:hypothetical protein
MDPENTQTPKDSPDASEELMDKLFGAAVDDDSEDIKLDDDDVTVDDNKPDDKPDGTDDVKDDADDIKDDVDDDEEFDWDKDEPVNKKEEDPEEDPKDETMARRMAKENGRKVKELSASLTEKELEVERIRKERDELEARVQEIESTRIKPEEHPEFVDLRQSIVANVTGAADLLSIPEPTLVPRNIGLFVDKYNDMVSKDGAERIAARDELKAIVVEKLKLSETSYGEMEDFEKKDLEPVITDVLRIVQQNTGKVRELQELHTKLSEKAKVGQLATGVRAYEAAVAEFSPVLDSVGQLADDVIESDPHSPAAVVARMIRDIPEGAKRLEVAKRDVLEALVGPRALTQAEIDKLEAQGTNLKTFMAERQKAHRAKQRKLAAMFVQGLMIRPVLKQALAEAAALKGKKAREDAELDLLDGLGKKKVADAGPKKSDKKKDPLSKLFPGGWDDDE